ncbi:MAG: phosphoglycerate dehydrogenase, partial [Planctomycetes bacterium]|nr:phosphoglycerate dehydrogenase [Planctomycetota bacterium]
MALTPDWKELVLAGAIYVYRSLSGPGASREWRYRGKYPLRCGGEVVSSEGPIDRPSALILKDVMQQVVVLDSISQTGRDLLGAAEGIKYEVRTGLKGEDLRATLGEFDGAICRSGVKITAEVLQGSRRLKAIARAGVGTDNIDLAAATRAGIVVMNTPGGNTISTCEHTFALLFSLCRNIPDAHASMAAGRWDRKKFMGSEVFDKTLGIIGVGRIGSAIAKRAQAFGMKIIAYDPILTKLKADALGIELVSVDKLIERSDFITVHAPKNPDTENMIRAEHFKRMKPTCRIINCARGGIVNESDLAEALRNGTIAGAGLDVYTSEPFENNPFIGLDNVVMTPHLAASTDEAQLTVAVDIAKQMVEFLQTGTIVNAVNVPSLDRETRAALAPMLYLAEKLGLFQARYTVGRPASIEIEYRGDLGITDTYPILSAILMGFLAPKVETVNTVSAPSLLRDHGIVSSETRSPEASDYGFQINVTVVTDQETVTVAGTLFGDDDPRICIIDGTRMDAVPEGWMVICMN